MASNYTENYGLCQWEATDQVLRTEFNEDNTKVDEALKALETDITQKADQIALDAVEALATSRFTKLKEASVTDNTRLFELDLSDIDWEAWEKVHIDIVSINTDAVQIHYNTTDNNTPNMVLGGIHGVHHRPRMTFFVGNDPQRWVFVQWGNSMNQSNITFTELKKLIFDTGVLDAGTTFTILGER